ncbi:MAG: raffinose/stachyose/melibiose transport system substrate-binding protein [Petroclostridium sp.]|jgi:raffinose/stachyose/melibiose transport system substrate-binding protein|nr:transporter substrate-binding protein [Clostridia bacterium]MDK2809756.1 raffinose/stachyose/melibiose transport system substrate-binding protein [Petroclostridium sp.]
MKKVSMKILSLIVAVMMTAGLAACGGKGSDSPGDTKAPSGAASQNETKKEDAKNNEGKTVNIKLWTLWTESSQDANAKAFRVALKSMESALPDIKVEHDATENESYKTKIKTAVAANEAPDVFFTWGAGFTKPFVDAGKVLPLDDYLKDGTADRLLPGATTYFTFNGKTYGLPYGQWVGVLYCNKELFEQNGIKMPDTYEDLVAAVKAFRAKGITPVTVGGKDRWPAMFWQNALAVRTAGAQASQSALAKEASFDQPEFIESAARLKELVELKAFNDGCLGLSYDEAKVPFLEGKIPMIYMGSWLAGEIEDDSSKVKGKIVAKMFPALNGGKGGTDEFLGGSIDGFLVNANAKDKEAAVKVAKYIAENIAKELNASGSGLPAWKTEPVDESKLNPVTVQIKELVKNAKAYVLAWDTFLEGADAETHKNLVAEIFAGKKSPEEFAKEMQKLNEKK